MTKPHLRRRILDRAFLVGTSSLFSPFGYAVVPASVARPCAWGIHPILGSFPPLQNGNIFGDRKDYFIHDGYKHREKATYFDDTKNSEGAQREVYEFAREICERENLTSVVDIGCGSGFKLMKYLGSLQTVGVDVPETCNVLRKRYPDRTWTELTSYKAPDRGVDLVIAADVIEHLENPDELMMMIRSIAPSYIILSTPDRDLLRQGTHDGPPLNPAHIREWSFREFGKYVRDYLEVVEHFISCAPQATQCVLCKPKA